MLNLSQPARHQLEIVFLRSAFLETADQTPQSNYRPTVIGSRSIGAPLLNLLLGKIKTPQFVTWQQSQISNIIFLWPNWNICITKNKKKPWWWKTKYTVHVHLYMYIKLKSCCWEKIVHVNCQLPHTGKQKISESMNRQHNLRSHFYKWCMLFLHLIKQSLYTRHNMP